MSREKFVKLVSSFYGLSRLKKGSSSPSILARQEISPTVARSKGGLVASTMAIPPSFGHPSEERFYRTYVDIIAPNDKNGLSGLVNILRSPF